MLFQVISVSNCKLYKYIIWIDPEFSSTELFINLNSSWDLRYTQHLSHILTIHKCGWIIIFRETFQQSNSIFSKKNFHKPHTQSIKGKKEQNRFFIFNSISFVFSVYTFLWQDKLSVAYWKFQLYNLILGDLKMKVKGRSMSATTSRMEHFVIIVNSWKPLNLSQVLHLGCCSSPGSASNSATPVDG